jgi:hypothetical protein
VLKIVIPEGEDYDEEKNLFLPHKEQPLTLEHSLVSISKWESKWTRPFLSKQKMTYEETIDYIRCMTLTSNVDPECYRRLTDENIRQVEKYIDAPMTATTFSNRDGKSPNRRLITSELIYYWMIALGIPFECQKWHLNRLITLIRVCNEENKPPKKMGMGKTMRQNHSLNAARRKALHTKG